LPRVTDEHPIFLWTAPIQKKDRRRACAVIIISLLIFLVLAPFTQMPMPQLLAFVPMYETAIPFSDLVTAAILLVQFNSTRSRAILALACGYLFTALMAIPHALTLSRSVFADRFARSGDADDRMALRVLARRPCACGDLLHFAEEPRWRRQAPIEAF